MGKHTCSVCDYDYDPAAGDPGRGIPPGTSFEDLPDDWKCLACMSSKDKFLGEGEQGSQTLGQVILKDQLEELVGGDEGARGSVLYKRRFENLSRVARKITSSLSIANILEMIRDEAKTTIPRAQEACLLIFDPEALHYTRPLHCAMYSDRINCQLCKRGRETIAGSLNDPTGIQCSFKRNDKVDPSKADGAEQGICEIALPIFDGEEPLATLDVIAKDGEGFDQHDITLLKDLADLAANAIINARSHWKMAQERLTMDSILKHLKPFVPETVKRIVEKDPFDPSLKKKDVDVSILFLDIAGYTKISQSLDQEKVNFIIEKYFSSFLDVIYERGGDINETAGDGLMVIFQGEAQEHALNASRAALDIRHRALEINEELQGRFEPVNVNMGINSGKASVGMTKFHGGEGTRMTFTASGPTTNLAARIASSATEGDILVGSETASRIRDQVPLHDRGSMLFKNIEKEVEVYSLIRAQ